jgi:hypothetical protein
MTKSIRNTPDYEFINLKIAASKLPNVATVLHLDR